MIKITLPGAKQTRPAKRHHRFFVLAFLMSTALAGWAQKYSWVDHYSGTKRIMGQKIAVAPLGDNYTTATFEGTATVSGVDYDASTSGQLLLKQDGAGTPKWVRPMKGVTIKSIKATEEHVYLAGYYNKTGAFISTHQFPSIGELYNGFIVRLTENGLVDLVVNLTGNDPNLNNIIDDMDIDAAGNMYITGRAGENAVLAGDTLNNSGRPMYFARINTDGKIGWVTTANTSGGAAITTSSKANKIFVSAFVEDGDVVNFDNSSVIYTHTSDGNPNGGFFLLSCDNTGKVLNTRMLVSSRFRIGIPLVAVSDFNELYLVMTNQYDSEHIFKFDTLLQAVWDFRDPDRDASVSAIAADVSGNLLMAGSVQGEATFSGTQLSGEGNWMGYVAKYNSNGDLVWVTGAINNSGDDGASISGVASDSHTDVYITGMFSVPVEFPGFGTYSPVVEGNTDMFVARIRGLEAYDGLTESRKGSMLVFPSINDGRFKIRIENGSAQSCTIRDISGRCVFESPVTGGQSTIEVNTTLTDGVYFVNVRQHDGGVSQNKIVVRN